MNNVLRTITDRIREEEGGLFREFRADGFPLADREAPRRLSRSGGRDFMVIAEVKRGSPSRGLMRADLDPTAVARAYEDGGAAAVSVITERYFFYGDKDHLRRIKRAVRLPVLRKDFIVHEYQVYESYNLGADLVLLIAACLSAAELRHLHRVAESLGLQTLVEVHDEQELAKAIEAAPRLMGINNRNLETFEVDWTTSLRLKPLIPATVEVISESGIRSREQIAALREAGFAGALIGEHLIRQIDPKKALEELIHGR
jgi:indole-3-glycerol phosphate synthase